MMTELKSLKQKFVKKYNNWLFKIKHLKQIIYQNKYYIIKFWIYFMIN